MARTWVATDDLVEGTLPRVCVRSGQPTEHLVRTRFSSAPPWVPPTLPPALSIPFGRASVDAAVPLRPSAQQRLVALGRVRNAAVVVAVLALAAGLGLGNGLLLILAAVAAVVAIAWIAVGTTVVVGGQLDHTGDWVELHNVHPRFAAASDARYEEAQPG